MCNVCPIKKNCKFNNSIKKIQNVKKKLIKEILIFFVTYQKMEK